MSPLNPAPQLVVEASSRRIVSLAGQWERHRGPLLAEYRHLRALRDSAQVRGCGGVWGHPPPTPPGSVYPPSHSWGSPNPLYVEFGGAHVALPIGFGGPWVALW